MIKPTLNGYRSALKEKETELSRALLKRNLIAIEHTAEELEQSILAVDREMAVLALDRDSRLLREVRSALARMDDGEYGVCEGCGAAIKSKRLHAIPWARYCVPCQEKLDGGPHPAALWYSGSLKVAA